jgi:sugar phosphate isomerase/epimerase
MKRHAIFPFLAFAVLVAASGCHAPVREPETVPAPELGLQAWTLRKLTLVETIAKASELGIRTIEVYPGQKLGGNLEGNLSPQLEPDKIDALKKILADHQVSIAGFGVVMQASVEEWKQIFTFAKSFGMRWISAEPPADMLPAIAKMAKAAEVRVAIHNHPSPSRYHDPVALMQELEPYGPELGLCADTGHWARSGFNPLDNLRLCLPRIVTLHFKDLNEWTKQAKDQPWGTGVSDAAGMLAALRQAGFTGVVLMEYENDSDQLLNDLTRCAEFFRAAMAAPLEKLVAGWVAPPGFSAAVDALWSGDRGAAVAPSLQAVPLFPADLANAEFPAGTWALTGGILKASGRQATLWTKKDYGDFLLDLEFRAGEGGNSGIFFRGDAAGDGSRNALEVEISQPGATPEGAMDTGALWGVQAPARKFAVKPGEWHRLSLLVENRNILVIIDGEKLVDANLQQWNTAGRNPDGTPNGFPKPLNSLPRKGRIGLQDHRGPVEFRNISILAL